MTIEVKRKDCNNMCDFNKINEVCIECEKIRKPVSDVKLKVDEKEQSVIDAKSLQTFEEKIAYVDIMFKNLRNIKSEFLVGESNEFILKVIDVYKGVEMNFTDDEKFEEFFKKFSENEQYIKMIDEFGKSVLSLIIDEKYKAKYIDRFRKIKDGLFNWLKRLNANKRDIVVISLYVLSGGIFYLIKALI